MTSDVQARLMAIQVELTRVRQHRARRATGNWSSGVQLSALGVLGALVAGLLGTAVLLFALMFVLTALDGELADSLGAIVCGVPLAYVTFRLGRPLMRATARAQHDGERLGQQERQLRREAAWLTGRGSRAAWLHPSWPSDGHDHADARGAWVTGPWPSPQHLPARPERQPSSWAQLMHAKHPWGRSPERALRELPDDAPAWKVAFHRNVGWGGLSPILFIVGGLVAGVALSYLS